MGVSVCVAGVCWSRWVVECCVTLVCVRLWVLVVWWCVGCVRRVVCGVVGCSVLKLCVGGVGVVLECVDVVGGRAGGC